MHALDNQNPVSVRHASVMFRPWMLFHSSRSKSSCTRWKIPLYGDKKKHVTVSVYVGNEVFSTSHIYKDESGVRVPTYRYVPLELMSPAQMFSLLGGTAYFHGRGKTTTPFNREVITTCEH